MKLNAFIIIGLTGIFSLFGNSAHAQLGKQVINMDNPDYNLDVAYYFSESIDVDNPEHGNSSTGVYYKKSTLMSMPTKTEEPHLVMVYYKNEGGSVYKEATFCGFDFGKLDMTTTAQGKLIAIDSETVTDKKGFDKMVKAAKKKYGKPAKKETDEEDFDKILKASMLEYDENQTVYLWELEDEYIVLYTESGSTAPEGDGNESVEAENTTPYVKVKLSRIKKELERLLNEAFRDLIEDSKELIETSKKLVEELEEFEKEILGGAE
jgi:hypothetical protein